MPGASPKARRVSIEREDVMRITYTIMQRRHYYDGTLGVIRGWHTALSNETGQEIIATTSSEARMYCERLGAGQYELAHGEYASPDYGYVQPSGKIRPIA
jgi:dTDP-4-dehydrorhamnose 3,5-epimerase-like enzyme